MEIDGKAKVCDLEDAVLAEIAMHCVAEIHRREQERRDTSLEQARAQFPALLAAWRAAGLGMSLISVREGPVQPEWAAVPVIAGVNESYHRSKPRTKKDALVLARQYGDGGWMTMGEAWMFASGYGPVVDRAMYKWGYGGDAAPPPHGYERPGGRAIRDIVKGQ